MVKVATPRSDALRDVLRWLQIAGYYQGLQASMRGADLRPGRAWDETEQNIRKAWDDGSGKRAVRNAIRETVLFGRKTVRLIQIEAPVVRQLMRLAHEDWDPIELRLDGEDDPPRLVHVALKDGLLRMVYRSLRKVVQQTDVSVDLLTAEGRAELGEVDELRAVKRLNLPGFDVLEVDTQTGLSSVRIDDRFAQTFHLAGRSAFYEPLLVQIQSDAGVRLDVSTTRFFDLFDLVRKLYDSPDGRVAELKFDIASGSVHTATHRQRPLVDVRDDVYHKAGLAKVVHIYPFAIAVAWDVREEVVDTEAELRLIGTRAMGRSAVNAALHGVPRQGVLQVAEIHKAYTAAEYNKILAKLLTWSKKLGPPKRAIAAKLEASTT